jgi:hypothetical protein
MNNISSSAISTVLSNTEVVYYEKQNIQKFLVLFELFFQDTGLKK